jgi:hypothetical protein
MFNKRHEQDLAEIKALTRDISRRFDEVLKELERIKRAPDRGGADKPPVASVGGETGDGKQGERRAKGRQAGESGKRAGGKRRRRAAGAAVTDDD